MALKIYCIQAVQAPKFDILIILLGNFHIELAFFGGVGTHIADSGVEHLLYCIVLYCIVLYCIVL